MTGYVIETEYELYYSTRKIVPISEIVDALRAAERMIKRTPKFLEHHYKHISISETTVYVESIEAGSLREKLVVKYIFGTEENYAKSKELVQQIMSDAPVIRTIVAMGVGALIYQGVVSAVGSSGPTSHIEAYNNNIINVGGTVDFKSTDIQAILESVSDKKKLARDAVDLVKPAKSESGGSSIEMNGITALTFSEAQISQTPDEYEVPVPDEKVTKYKNVGIVVFASDRDSYEKGWAGIVPGVVESRVKFVLNDAVDPSKVHGRTKLKADIAVVERYNSAKKKYKPTLVEVELIN